MSSTLEISEARVHLNTMDERLRAERVIYVTRHRRPVFALVDAEYFEVVLDTLDILADPEALNMLRDALADIRAGRLHPHPPI
jgi:antitoxin YefM